MLHVHYAPELMEQAVRLAVHRDAAMEAELHRRVDPIFAVQDAKSREAHFQTAFGEWFVRLRLDRWLHDLLSLFPLTVQRVERVIVRTASRRASEGAELFVGADDGHCTRTLIVQLRAESVVAVQLVWDKLLRELQHVEDMLDERFAYEPEPIEGLPARQQIIRDRYFVLWAVRVEAQLVRKGLLCSDQQFSWQRDFDRVFPVKYQESAHKAFRYVWDKPQRTHAQLWAWAKNPAELFSTTTPEEADGQGTPSPGSPCPACGFPTYDWYEQPSVAAARLQKQGQSDPTAHAPGSFLCRQCAEVLLENEVERFARVQQVLPEVL